MGVSVDTKRAQLPLPGGREGATVSVEPLLCAEQQAPPGFFDRPRGRTGTLRALLTPRSRWISIPIQAFLLRHPGAGAILVDTGFHPSVAVDPKRNLGQIPGRIYSISMEHDQAVGFLLKSRGLSAADVRYVVMTHLHYDHASGISQFPDAVFVVDDDEWHHAARGGMADGYTPRHFDHAFDWRGIDFDSHNINSFASFGRTVDLFGDGSVRLLSTPGHSFGHMSVLARLKHDREVLICGDAIYSRASLHEDLEPLFAADRHLYERSRGEIRRYAEQTPTAVVIPGHDPQAWASLEPRYE